MRERQTKKKGGGERERETSEAAEEGVKHPQVIRLHVLGAVGYKQQTWPLDAHTCVRLQVKP